MTEKRREMEARLRAEREAQRGSGHDMTTVSGFLAFLGSTANSPSMDETQREQAYRTRSPASCPACGAVLLFHQKSVWRCSRYPACTGSRHHGYMEGSSPSTEQQQEAQGITAEKVQFWQNGIMITAQMTRKQAQAMVEAGLAYVISAQAIGDLDAQGQRRG